MGYDPTVEWKLVLPLKMLNVDLHVGAEQLHVLSFFVVRSLKPSTIRSVVEQCITCHILVHHGVGCIYLIVHHLLRLWALSRSSLCRAVLSWISPMEPNHYLSCCLSLAKVQDVIIKKKSHIIQIYPNMISINHHSYIYNMTYI